MNIIQDWYNYRNANWVLHKIKELAEKQGKTEDDIIREGRIQIIGKGKNTRYIANT